MHPHDNLMLRIDLHRLLRQRRYVEFPSPVGSFHHAHHATHGSGFVVCYDGGGGGEAVGGSALGDFGREGGLEPGAELVGFGGGQFGVGSVGGVGFVVVLCFIVVLFVFVLRTRVVDAASIGAGQIPSLEGLQIGHDEIVNGRVNENNLPIALGKPLHVGTLQGQLPRGGIEVINILLFRRTSRDVFVERDEFTGHSLGCFEV
mmetsp:Transcript_9796/g.19290  ORF Transcript_9796/g.19290 Transcript_9796/m.19290 type:complete len:203 (+) Transcript_9796:408-1016(+)